MAPGSLRDYDRKRNFERTPEPAGGKPARGRAKQLRFVVQEHHATRLHWDFRLERDGVLVSWAVPKGIPEDPRRNHLAVHVEDHPLLYIDFAGQIPEGNYGAGRVSVWDHGTYETHKWQVGPEHPKQEVQVTLHGARLEGRYALFQTRGKDWMIHRMDPPQDPDWEPMPARVEPMAAKLARGLPADQSRYGFEFKWDGVRAVAYSQGGTLVLLSRSGEDITRRYPEVRGLADQLGSHAAVLDGEIVAFDGRRPSFEKLQGRMGLNGDAEVRRAMREVPVVYLVFDVLYLDGRSTIRLPYRERRARLEALGIAGGAWQVPPWSPGDGEAMLAASETNRFEGVMAKRLDSVYEPGRRSDAWLKVKNHARQELVIGGWLEGQGRRQGVPGAILVGYYDNGELVYAGKVGTGFTEKELTRLSDRFKALARDGNPFSAGAKPPRAAHFVEPVLVCEVEFNEWTRAGQLRAPSYQGLREDKPASAVVRERPVELS